MTPIKLQISLSTDKTHSFGNVLPEYVSTTMDWWPPSDIAWGNSSVINANLSHPKLIAAARGLSPFYLRIGGSQADEIIYNFPSGNETMDVILEDICKKQRQKCLTSQRWDDVLSFANNVGARIVFTLAYVMHTRDADKVNDQHDWDPTNARLLLKHTSNSKYASTVHGFELGNELRHKHKVKNVTRIVEAYKKLRVAVNDMWSASKMENVPTPLLFGPASTGTGETKELVAQLGPYIDVVTYHKYHGGGKDDMLPKYASSTSFYNHPYKLSAQSDAVAKYMSNNPKKAQLWVGEGAMAYNSGRPGVTDSFLGSLWFANLLGVLTKTSPVPHSVYCRQALIGGYYELVNHENNNFVPNPDYWVSYMWKNVIGSSKAIGPIVSPNRIDTVEYSTKFTFGCCKNPGSDSVLVHAFCANSDGRYGASGDVVFIVINVSKDKAVQLTVPLGSNRTEYVMTPNKGMQSRVVQLNGDRMIINQNNELAILQGIQHRSDETTTVPPSSITFVVVHGAKVRQCSFPNTTPSKSSEFEQATSTTLSIDKLSREDVENSTSAKSADVSSLSDQTISRDKKKHPKGSFSGLRVNPKSNATNATLHINTTHTPTSPAEALNQGLMSMDASSVGRMDPSRSKYGAMQSNFIIAMICASYFIKAWYKRRVTAG